MRNYYVPLIFGCLCCALPSAALADGLGLNFAPTDPDAESSSLEPSEVAGVVPQSNWNNLLDPAEEDGANGTDIGDLVLSDGSASGVTVSWSSPNTWRSDANSAFPDGPDGKLTNGYLDTGDTAELGISISVNDIDEAIRTPAYDVYVYFVSDSGDDRGGGYTIDDGSGPIVKYGSTLAAPSSFIEDPGTDIDNSIDGTYLRFAGLTGSAFTLTTDTTLTTPNGFRAPINAVQIVLVPEPAGVVLTCCGAAAIAGALTRRRRAR